MDRGDVEQMENGLLELLDNFKQGKLHAFGNKKFSSGLFIHFAKCSLVRIGYFLEMGGGANPFNFWLPHD